MSAFWIVLSVIGALGVIGLAFALVLHFMLNDPESWE